MLFGDMFAFSPQLDLEVQESQAAGDADMGAGGSWWSSNSTCGLGRFLPALSASHSHALSPTCHFTVVQKPHPNSMLNHNVLEMGRLS